MGYDPTKHLIRVQGNREYLPVAQRLVWFREIHPDWGIETKIEVLDIEKGAAVFSATVYNEVGKVMAQATRMETARGFADYLEKAETGAVGRALALCGFGTQFAPELEEGERIVDSPHPVGKGARRDAAPRGRIGGAAAPQAEPVPAPPVVEGPPAGPGAAGNGNGALACVDSACGRPMTKGQYELSVRRYGKALCPQCQKQEQASAAGA